jgi:hypothetical protein
MLMYCSRRMMMTSGSGINYKSMFDAGSQVGTTSFGTTKVFAKAIYIDYCKGRYEVSIQGCGCKRPARCSWSWSAVTVRQAAGGDVWQSVLLVR